MADLKAEIDSVNRERKLQQTAAGQELAALEAEWQVSRHLLVHSAAYANGIVHMQPLIAGVKSLTVYHSHHQELVQKNGEIERACRMVEEELALMQAASQPAQQCVPVTVNCMFCGRLRQLLPMLGFRWSAAGRID